MVALQCILRILDENGIDTFDRYPFPNHWVYLEDLLIPSRCNLLADLQPRPSLDVGHSDSALERSDWNLNDRECALVLADDGLA